jgi:hypothetical protein
MISFCHSHARRHFGTLDDVTLPTQRSFATLNLDQLKTRSKDGLSTGFEGEDLRDPETALSCLQVFALGGLKGEADAANSGPRRFGRRRPGSGEANSADHSPF